MAKFPDAVPDVQLFVSDLVYEMRELILPGVDPQTPASYHAVVPSSVLPLLCWPSFTSYFCMSSNKSAYHLVLFALGFGR